MNIKEKILLTKEQETLLIPLYSKTQDGRPAIRLKEEWFFSQSPDLDRLDWFYRLMFRLTGSIQAAQRAQRLLYFTL